MVENTVIEFVYAGGSTPGKVRKVFITEIGKDDFAGYDFSRGHFRRFKTRKASKIATDTTAKIVNVNALPSSITNADIELGLKRDKYVVYNGGDRIVGVKLPIERLTVTDNVLTFEGVNGKLVVNIAGGRLSVYENGRGINQNPDDPLPLLKAIQRVLGA